MNEGQGIFTQLGQSLDRYFSERRAAAQGRTLPTRLAWLHWLGRQLVPNISTLVLVAILIATQNAWARALSPAAPGPSATTVNYQGRLANSGGDPVPDGNYGMSFALYDASIDGSLVWGPESHTAVPVKSGLFSVGLGSQTSGGIPTTTWNGDRYLEITVGGETLSPRELIRSVPIAGMALTVPDGAIGAAQIADGAVSSAKIAVGAVDSNGIADNAVGTAELADKAVTSRKVNLTSGGVYFDNTMTLQETQQDIPGMSATVAVATNSTIIVYAVFDLDVLSATAVGELKLNGSTQSAQAIMVDSRGTAAQVYRLQVAPGSHTLQLSARRPFGSGGSVAHHTSLVWFVVAR